MRQASRRPLEWEGPDSHYVIAEVPQRRGVSWWQVYDNRVPEAYSYVRRLSSLDAALREVVSLLDYDYAVAEGCDR